MASSKLLNETTTEEAEVKADSSKKREKEYLTLRVPKTYSKVKVILFECESHDQGFADHKNRSYSWGDLVVKSSSGEELFRLNRVYENAVANSNYQMHVQHYSEDDEIVQECKPGSTLQLILNAQYRNWENHAKYGRIAVYVE